MEFIADLHIHSRFSRATSRKLDLPLLDFWARRKGLALIGTGDISHPEWLAETREQLVEAEEGFYRLKEAPDDLKYTETGGTRFILSAEISSIYKKRDRVRKIHSLILLPNFEIAEKFGSRLDKIGNIRSDGRPILGLDAKDLLELCLDTSPDIIFIPAHIWTPWFSLLGSKSGFDSVEECFEDLSGHIFALETGLSSDPAMNWRVSSLDNYTLVSNSDAHSAAKLGREANLFSAEFSFPSLTRALKGEGGFQGTIEFFPEEGKYHLDGHRKCGQRLEPEETVKNNGLCPVCGKSVTLGVLYRVLELADRSAGGKSSRANPFHSLVPLTEILSECLGVGPQSKKVGLVYDELLNRLGPELFILREAAIRDVTTAGGELLGLGIKRMREGKVQLTGGYDGEFGHVRVFDPAERESLAGQNALFALAPVKKKKKARAAQKEKLEPQKTEETPSAPVNNDPVPGALFAADPLLDDLNALQLEAVVHGKGPLCIVAGPGTGKTLVLTRRICWLVREGLARPEEVLGITFTRKAKEEMSSRLLRLMPYDRRAEQVPVMTFHAFGARILKEFAGLEADVLPEEKLLEIARELAEGSISRPREILREISLAKQNLSAPRDLKDLELARTYQAYEEKLSERGGLDFDDLILRTVRLMEDEPNTAEAIRNRYGSLLIDEYQDVNLAQYRLTKHLANGPEPNLTVIGDPDQAIYGFRGADAAYFKRFLEDFPKAGLIRLNRNYRSTDTILTASTRVIVKNPGEDRVGLYSGISGPKQLTMAVTASPAAEARFVVKQIEGLVGGTSHLAMETGLADPADQPELSLGDIAVLYRLHALAGPLTEALGRAGLPCQLAGTEPLHETDHLDFNVEKISLLTMHAAKGLEFPVVFIIGAEQGLLPYEPLQGEPSLIEEERRLFYVAMTRAMKKLIITRSRSRSLFGRSSKPRPSIFLRGIPSHLKSQAKITHRAKPRARQLELF